MTLNKNPCEDCIFQGQKGNPLRLTDAAGVGQTFTVDFCTPENQMKALMTGEQCSINDLSSGVEIKEKL